MPVADTPVTTHGAVTAVAEKAPTCTEEDVYKRQVLLQKSYTVDFLTKKKKKNNGELTQYYITDTVSYTHLDVYKRQVWGSQEHFYTTHPSCCWMNQPAIWTA